MVDRLFRITLGAICFLSAIPFGRAAEQVFQIREGWNLVQFQVTPPDPAPEAVFATMNSFESLWSYETSSGNWQRYVKPHGAQEEQARDSLSNALFGIERVSPGKGYWLYSSAPVQDWKVSGTLPVGNELTVSLAEGWNLVGFPISATSFPVARGSQAAAASKGQTLPVKDKLSLLGVLSAAGLEYDAVVTWDLGNYRKMFRVAGQENVESGTTASANPLAGLPSDPPFPTYVDSDLQRGYWVHVTHSAKVRPRLIATVRPDFDAVPIGNFPSREDIDIQDGPPAARPRRQARNFEDQKYIRFFPGEDLQTLSISNLGKPNDPENAGGGVLTWRAKWKPKTDLPGTDASYEHWVRLFKSIDEKEERDANGNLLHHYDEVAGATTVGNEAICLRLDTKNLGGGTHEGELILETNVGTKTYTIRAEVGAFEGDWKGYAVINTVNGRQNPVPDIDLYISFYQDRETPNVLRGIIDSSNAVLWPVDVPLFGYRVAPVNNEFNLNGSFALPPGDQNKAPYDKFPDGDDVDFPPYNSLETHNPFPFPIQRVVSLQGGSVPGKSAGVLEGIYTEIIYGMTSKPLELVGKFHLERDSARAFEKRRLVNSDSGIESVIVKGPAAPVTLKVEPGRTRTSPLTLNTEINVQELAVSLTFAPTQLHEKLVIKLKSPDPDAPELVVYDGHNPSGALTPMQLQKVTFPKDRPFDGELEQFLFHSDGGTPPKRVRIRTRSDPDSGTYWMLSITNFGEEPVVLQDWRLRIAGQAVADVYGKVVDPTGNPVANATVQLDQPYSDSTVTDQQGRFIFKRLPLCPLNFSASAPGYQNPAAPGLSNEFTRPFVGAAGLSPAAAELVKKFNPLAGAPPESAHVAGFTSGTEKNPFILVIGPHLPGPDALRAAPDNRRRLAAGRRTVAHERIELAQNNVVPPAPEPAPPQQGRPNVIDHTAHVPGVYRDKPPGATLNAVVVMPTVRRVPVRPADLGGEGPGPLDPHTAQTPYSAYCFMPFFAGGGSLPAARQSGGPTAPDVYQQLIQPKEIPVTDPPAKVTHLTLQHCYCATADIDLAPTGPVDVTHPFAVDGFGSQPPGGIFSDADFNGPDNLNAQGFKQEDFHYALITSPYWENTRRMDVDNSGNLRFEYSTKPVPIIWGNATPGVPAIDWAAQPQKSVDDVAFTVSSDEDVFHPHTGKSVHADAADPAFRTVTHYRMTCFIGGGSTVIMTANIQPTSIRRAKGSRLDPEPTNEPALTPGPKPEARNFYYQLHTGGLGSQPVAPQNVP